MNIGSVLIGVSVFMAAGSAAYAAEPMAEPVEYVRVCDVYGPGFFYIPGTETCLRVGGYVRFEAGADSASTGDDFGHFYRGGRTINGGDTYGTFSRFSLMTWTGSETELGSLRTFTETRFNWESGGNSGVGLTSAYLELGGLMIGKAESAFNQWFGYATALGINDAMVGYGPYDTNTIRFTKSFDNGFAVQVAAESGAYGDEIDSYVPHLLAGAKYGWQGGALIGMVAYDSNYEEWAAKVRLNLDVIPDKLKLALMATYGATDDGRDSNYFNNWSGDWAVHGGASVRLSEKTWFNTQASYSDGEHFAAFANIQYDLGNWPTNTQVIFEVDYQDNLGTSSDGVLGGVIRIDRNF